MSKVLEFIQTNCKSALKAQPIWKGMSIKDKYIHLDSRTQPLRRSANTLNIVHLFIHSMPGWNVYPRRQVICTTSRMYAGGYGNPYRVFPVDGTIIGVCPAMDFWILPHLFSKTELNVQELDSQIVMIGYQLLGREINKNDSNKLLNDLREMAKVCIAKKKSIPFLPGKITDENSIIVQLTDALDPVKNQLRTTPIESFTAGKQEVWFDGEAVLIAEKETWKLGIKEFR